jgi:hypothetical protein
VCYHSWDYKKKLNGIHEPQKYIYDVSERINQQCYNKPSEKSWNIGNIALKWAATINVLLKLKQNSVI